MAEIVLNDGTRVIVRVDPPVGPCLNPQTAQPKKRRNTKENFIIYEFSDIDQWWLMINIKESLMDKRWGVIDKSENS